MDKVEIKKDKLFLVEGNDDQNFFQKLMQKISIDNIQIISLGGKDKFKTPNFRSVINAPGFREIKSLGIVRDADEDGEDAFKSICAVLKECGLPEPTEPMEITGKNLKVGILIIPPSSKKGKIEDLCLFSLKEHTEMSCVDNYFKCLKKNLSSEKFPKDLSKAKIQAFLASREESVPHLGIAAQRSYFPLEHDVFKEVKDFIKKL